MATIIEHEVQECERANATGRQPVVFVHGLWLLPSSWDRWAKAFEDAEYTTLTPGWPDDPETVAEAKAKPEVFAQKTVGEVADHFEEIIRNLKRKPPSSVTRSVACSRRSWPGVGWPQQQWLSTPLRSVACFRFRSQP